MCLSCASIGSLITCTVCVYWCCTLYCIVCLYRRFFMGTVPYLLVSDVDMLKHILVKDFECFTDKPVSPNYCGLGYNNGACIL